MIKNMPPKKLLLADTVKVLEPRPIRLDVELLSLVAFRFIAKATAFASVAKVGKAPRNASALVEKLAGSKLLGGVGSAVIAMIFLR